MGAPFERVGQRVERARRHHERHAYESVLECEEGHPEGVEGRAHDSRGHGDAAEPGDEEKPESAQDDGQDGIGGEAVD
jgi:hypothetical protein